MQYSLDAFLRKLRAKKMTQRVSQMGEAIRNGDNLYNNLKHLS